MSDAVPNTPQTDVTSCRGSQHRLIKCRPIPAPWLLWARTGWLYLSDHLRHLRSPVTSSTGTTNIEAVESLWVFGALSLLAGILFGIRPAAAKYLVALALKKRWFRIVLSSFSAIACLVAQSSQSFSLGPSHLKPKEETDHFTPGDSPGDLPLGCDFPPFGVVLLDRVRRRTAFHDRSRKASPQTGPIVPSRCNPREICDRATK